MAAMDEANCVCSESLLASQEYLCLYLNTKPMNFRTKRTAFALIQIANGGAWS